MQCQRHIVISILAAVFTMTPSWAQSTSTLLQKGIFTEETVGDLDAAIKIYEEIVADAEKNRAYAAQAQYRIGTCYLKQGRNDRAVGAFQKLIEQFPKQNELVAQANVRLLKLGYASGRTTPAEMTVRRVWAGPGVDVYGSSSPDGRYLSYVDWNTGALALRDLAAGTNRYLTSTDYPNTTYMEYALNSIVSRDGKQIAYAWMNEESFVDLRIIGLDGSEPRVLHANKEVGYTVPMEWSPDDKYILATFTRQDGTHQIVMVSVADGSVRVLRTVDWRYPQRLSFSPDGRSIIYDFPQDRSNPARDVYLLSLDGSFESTIVEHPANDYLLGWIPESANILFASDRTGKIGIWMVELADGKAVGTPQLVKQEVGRIRAMGFTKNRSLYYNVDASELDVYLAELDLQSGNLLAPPNKITQRFEGTNSAPDWSPDGKYLLYVSQRDRLPFGNKVSNKVLVIRSLETGEERELSPEVNFRTSRGGPSWSPDGRSILLSGQDKKNRPGLFRLDVETGEVSTIVRRRVKWPVWTPDGQAIFWRSRDPESGMRTLMVYDVETGQEQTLYSAHHLHAWALSPDGRRLAVATEDPDTSEPNLEDDVVKVISVTPQNAGEILIRLPGPEEIGAISWTPDGQALLVEKRRQSDTTGAPFTYELWRVSAAGGTPRKLDLAIEGMHNLRIHPDGRRIAYTVGSGYMPEVWVMENFLPELPAAK